VEETSISKAQRSDYYQRPEDGGDGLPCSTLPAEAGVRTVGGRVVIRFGTPFQKLAFTRLHAPGHRVAPPPPPPPPPPPTSSRSSLPAVRPGAGASFGSLLIRRLIIKAHGFTTVSSDSPYSSAYAAQPSPARRHLPARVLSSRKLRPSSNNGSYSYDGDQHMLKVIIPIVMVI
jgi:hypothetical protein